MAPCAAGPVKLAEAWVSYTEDTAKNVPSTGDIVYLRAVQWNISGCLNDEARFFFTLPEGAILATSSTTKVECLRGNLAGFVEEFPKPDEQGASCLNEPLVTPNGLFFGNAPVPGAGTWFVEIRVPVRFDKRLVDDPRTGLRVKAFGFGVPAESGKVGPLELSVGTPVEYRPFMDNHASTPLSDGFSADMHFDVYNFYEEGIVEIAHGTDANNLYKGSPVFLTQATALGHTGASIRVTSLTPGATNFWRVKITNKQTSTTYFGPLQTVVTPPASLQPRPPRCRFWGGC